MKPEFEKGRFFCSVFGVFLGVLMRGQETFIKEGASREGLGLSLEVWNGKYRF